MEKHLIVDAGRITKVGLLQTSVVGCLEVVGWLVVVVLAEVGLLEVVWFVYHRDEKK